VASQAGLQTRAWPSLESVGSVETDLKQIHDVAFSPDGNRLLAVGGSPSEFGELQVFSWPEQERLAASSVHDDVIYAVAWQSNDCFTTVAADNLVIDWKLGADGVAETRRLTGHSRRVLSVTYLDQAGLLVTAGVDHSLRVWKEGEQESQRVLDNHTGIVRDLAVRPGDHPIPYVASASADKTVRIWQPTIGRLVRFARLPVEPLSLAWSVDGTSLAVGGTDGKLRIVDAATVQIKQEFDAIDGWAYEVIAAADGSFVVGGTGGQLVHLVLENSLGLPSLRHSALARPSDLEVAETILLYQRATGGWPKNYDRRQPLTVDQRNKILQDKTRRDDSTIDNGATHTEIRLLAKAYNATGDERFQQAFLRGVAYLLAAQYENGGWPQKYPQPTGYAKHITFNDNAMIGVLRVLRDVAHDHETYSFVPKSLRDRCDTAVNSGIACILKCQISLNGQLTVWCAQHDEVTYEPRKARSYELPSLSGSESVGIVRFLMEIDDPSDEVVQAINAAITWFQRSQLTNIKVVRIDDETKPKGRDRVVVSDPQAPPMWARFYDLQTNEPFFCSRDGIPRKSLAEISHERRNGYSWLGYYAQDLLAQDYPAWEKRIGRE
jgi:PelA/Pel-15E family pectate lyase